MAFQPVPNTAKVAVVTTNGFSEYVNVFHFYRDGLWGQPELSGLLQVVATAWVNEIMTSIHSDIVFVRVEGRGLRAPDDVAAEFVLPTPSFGTRGGSLSPANVSFAVTHLTGLAGRSNRGRTFFVGLSESDTVGDLIVAARADALRNGLGVVRQQAADAGWTMVVVSRRANNVLLPVARTIPITGFRWRDRILDSQRRRLTGRGR